MLARNQIRSAGGLSGSINTGADKAVFGLLRALSDVVLVGAGTARAEGYGPLSVDVRWQGVRDAMGMPGALPLVVVSNSGDLPDRLAVADGSVVAAVPGSVAPALASSVGAD